MSPTKEMALLFAHLILAWLLWRTWVIYPIQLFTTLLHEAGHAAGSLLTGGRVEKISINRRLGGICVTRGGSRIIILNAGYLGSFLLGLLIFCLSYTAVGGYVLMAVGVLVLATALLWVKDSFTLFFSLATAVFLVSLKVLLPEFWLLFAAKFVALCCLLHAFIEINHHRKSLEFTSDAQSLEKVSKLPAWAWAWFWRVTSLAAIVFLCVFILKNGV